MSGHFVQISEEFEIVRGSVREPSLLRLHNGNLLASWHGTPDVHFAHRPVFRSRDSGKTWQPDPARGHREQAIGQAANGEVLAFDIYTFEREPGIYVGSLFRSKDGGETFAGPELIEVRMDRVRSEEYPTEGHFPDSTHVLAKFYVPLPDYYAPVVAASSRRRGFIFWRYALEEDGRWIAAMQGHFHGDRCHRTVLVESLDGGRSWDYVTTITYTHDEPADGFCEPVLAKLRDGRLLCLLRRGGILPMASTCSVDGGRTWGVPKLIKPHGVDPDLCLLPNGVLVCSFGRLGRYLGLSFDGTGESWDAILELPCSHSSCYMGIASVSDDQLVVLYDDRLQGAPTSGDVPPLLPSGKYNPEFHKHQYIGGRFVTVRPNPIP